MGVRAVGVLFFPPSSSSDEWDRKDLDRRGKRYFGLKGTGK